MGEIIGIVSTIVGILVVVVNIITEVAKKVVPGLDTSKHINTFVLALSIMLTCVSGAIYLTQTHIAMEWYYVPIALVVGVFVAYAAMFGYDKLLVYLEDLKNGNS